MQYEMLGDKPNLVAVPTGFFKVVLGEMPGGQTVVAAFALPNTPIDPSLPLVSFLVRLDDIERVTGLQLFPHYLTDQTRRVIDEKAMMIKGGTAITDGSTTPQEPLLALEGDKPPPPLPKKKHARSSGDGNDPMHLCEILLCQLPMENWWETKKGGGGSNKEAKASKKATIEPQ